MNNALAPSLKRALAGLASGLLAITLVAGCSGQAERHKPVVITTFTVLADMVSSVGGDAVDVHSITKPGAEIHGYEPTPKDLTESAKADLIVDNGLGLEGWFAQFTQDLEAPRLLASEGVEPMAISEDAAAGQDNPHAWMSPENGAIYIDNVVRGLSDLVPDRAADFEGRGEAVKRELAAITDSLRTAADGVPAQQRMLVTCEGAFSYLARDAGLDEQFLWAVNADQQATPHQIERAIGVVRERKVPAVFCESTVSDKAMRQVIEATGARFGGTLYVDSLSEADGPVPTYLDLLRYDANLIVTALEAEARK